MKKEGDLNGQPEEDNFSDEQRRKEQILASFISNLTIKVREGQGGFSPTDSLPALLAGMLSTGRVVVAGEPLNFQRWWEIVNNPLAREAFVRGYSGENPPLANYEIYIPSLPVSTNWGVKKLRELVNSRVVSSRQPGKLDGELELVGLDIPELTEIDSSLPHSLLAHTMIANWMPNLYLLHQENLGLTNYRIILRKLIPEESNLLLAWQICESLWDQAKQNSVWAISLFVPPLSADSSLRKIFPTMESFLSSSGILSAFYYQGWAKRLFENDYFNRLKKKLFPDKEGYTIARYAIFLRRDEGGLKQIADVLKEAVEGNYEGAKTELATICAKEGKKNRPPPLPDFAIEELGIEEQIKALKVLIESNARQEKQRELTRALDERAKQRREAAIREQKTAAQEVVAYLAKEYNIDYEKAFNLIITVEGTEKSIAPGEKHTFRIENGQLVVAKDLTLPGWGIPSSTLRYQLVVLGEKYWKILAIEVIEES